MAMTQGTIAVGVFPDDAQARRAIDELKRAGFSDDEIGFLTRARTGEISNEVMGDAASGAVGGGLLGGLLGAAAALLIPGIGPAIAGGILAATVGGVAIGAAAGGIIASLTSIGIVESDARFYQRELEAGHTIVTVKAPSGYEEALEIMRRNGADTARNQPGTYTATPPQRPYGETIDPDGPPANEQ